MSRWSLALKTREPSIIGTATKPVCVALTREASLDSKESVPLQTRERRPALDGLVADVVRIPPDCPFSFAILQISYLVTTLARRSYRKTLAVFQVVFDLRKQRSSRRVSWNARAQRIKATRTQDVPCGHLPAIFVTDQAVGRGLVKLVHDLPDVLLRFPRLAGVVV